MIIFINVLLGLFLGSFFNAMIIRFKKEESFLKVRSTCDSCECRLKWYDLVPVLSYVILRGRCRKCGAKIPPVHLYAEIIFGLGYGVIGYLIPVCAALQIFLMYIAVTVTGISAISDCTDSQVYTMIIDWACVLVFVLKLYVMIDAQKYEPAVIYTATTAAAIGIMAACAYADKEAHLGYGDYHLILLIFLCTGIQGLFYTVFFGSAAGLVIHSPKLASGRRKQKIPFVPLFYYGYLLTLIF